MYAGSCSAPRRPRRRRPPLRPGRLALPPAPGGAAGCRGGSARLRRRAPVRRIAPHEARDLQPGRRGRRRRGLGVVTLLLHGAPRGRDGIGPPDPQRSVPTTHTQRRRRRPGGISYRAHSLVDLATAVASAGTSGRMARSLRANRRSSVERRLTFGRSANRSGSHMDRMSPLDASFLHIEGPVSPMHIGSVAVFEGPAPARGDVEAMVAASSRPCRATARRCASCRSTWAGRSGSTTPLQPRLPPAPHRAAGARRRRRAAQPGRTGDVAAARPHQAALGDVDGRGPRGRALGAHLQDPPLHGRRRLRHRPAGGRALDSSPEPLARRRPGSRARSRRWPNCWPTPSPTR